MEVVKNVRKNRVGDGRVGRSTFVEGDLVVSILGGIDIPESELRKQVISRCTKEKYRLKKYSSIALGMRVDDTLKPFALPEKYTTELFEQKCGVLFQHVLEKYPESGESGFEAAG